MSSSKNGRCHSPDTLRVYLNELHDTYMLTWRAIAERDEYAGDPPIPPGTLHAIAKGKIKIPRKWLRRLNVKRDGKSRLVIDLPPDTPADELEYIRSLTREERRERLLR